MSSWKRSTFALAASLALLAAACGGDERGGGTAGGGGGNGEPIRIGYPADLSEVFSYYDVPLRDGAQFAINEINQGGGVLGRPLEMLVRDTKNDVALGTRITQELLDEGVVYVIGTTGDTILSEGQLVCGAGIPMSTGDSTAPTLVEDMGQCAYQLVMSDNVQGSVAAEYALGQGYKTAYLLRSREIPYTANLPGYFREAFERGGGQIVGEDEYRIGAGDYSAQVTKISNLDPQPDVIFTPMFIPDTPVFLRQLRQAGVEVPVVSTDGNHDNALRDAGAQALDGLVFTTHAFPEEGTPLADFYEMYEQRTGKPPESVVVGIGYDEIYALKSAIEAAGEAEPQAIMQALASLEHDGVTGTITMDPETRRARKDVTLVRMDGTEFVFEDAFYPEFVPEP